MTTKQLLTALIIILISVTSAAEKKSIDSLNLTIELGQTWTVRDHPIAELAMMNLQTGEVLVVHKQPLHTINSSEQIPDSIAAFKTYVKENFLQSQLSTLAPLFKNEIGFSSDFKAIGFRGPLFEMTGDIKAYEMNFMMWLPWQGAGAYVFNYVSPKKLNRDKSDFLKLLKKFAVTDKNINPFITTNSIEVDSSKEPIIDLQFNTKLTQFKNFIPIDNKELEIQNDENFYSLMLVNVKTGDYISFIPHCFPMTDEQQNTSTKSFANFILDSTLVKKTFKSGNESITFYTGNGVSDDIKQLSIQSTMKKVGDCYHAILIATSNPMTDSENIKTIYDSLTNYSETAEVVNYLDDDQKTAFANYYIATAEALSEEGVDAEIFYVKTHELLESADSLTLLLDQLNIKQAYFKGLEYINNAEPNIQNNPQIKSWQAWFLRGTEAFDQAIGVYDELFSENYTSDEDFFVYLELLAAQSKWQQAHNAISTNLETISKRSSALALMMKYAAFSNNEKGAYDALELLNNENRLNIENVFDVADGLYELKAYDQLTDILNSQIAKHPENVRLHYYKADTFFSVGKYEEALTSIEVAEKISPENEQVKELMKLIQLNVGVGNYQKISTVIDPVTTPKDIKNKINKLDFINSGDAEYQFYTVGIEFKDKQKLKTTYSRKIRINNLKGLEKFKTITFDYDESYENVHINIFEVLNNDGEVINQLDLKSVYLSTKQDGIAADDDMTINIPVPNLSPGMTINYQITTETKSQQTALPYSKHYFISPYPMAMKTVFVIGDINHIHAVTKNPLTTLDKNDYLSWSSSDVAQLTYQPMMPYAEDISNWLILSEKNINWQDLGDEYLEMIDQKINSPISKAKKLAIFSGASTDLEKVIKAASFIQQKINYQAIEFGTRAMIPNTSSATLKTGYGDCKDHAVLLHDLLNEEGITAHIALVNTTELVNHLTPALDQFNHAVIYLPEIGGGMYIDTTDKELKIDPQLPPQNLLATSALVLNKNSSELKTIPTSSTAQSQIIVERQVSRDLTHLMVSETVQMTGYMASGMRYSLKNNQSAELMQNVQSWIASEYSELELMSFDYYGLGDNQGPLILEIKSKIEIKNNNNLIPFFFEKNYLNKNLATNRTIPFLLNTPFEFKSTTDIDSNIKVNKQHIEQNENSNEVASWQINFNNNQIIFSAANNRYQGDSETYNDFIKITKQGLKTLENYVDIEF